MNSGYSVEETQLFITIVYLGWMPTEKYVRTI